MKMVSDLLCTESKKIHQKLCECEQEQDKEYKVARSLKRKYKAERKRVESKCTYLNQHTQQLYNELNTIQLLMKLAKSKTEKYIASYEPLIIPVALQDQLVVEYGKAVVGVWKRDDEFSINDIEAYFLYTDPSLKDPEETAKELLTTKVLDKRLYWEIATNMTEQEFKQEFDIEWEYHGGWANVPIFLYSFTKLDSFTFQSITSGGLKQSE